MCINPVHTHACLYAYRSGHVCIDVVWMSRTMNASLMPDGSVNGRPCLASILASKLVRTRWWQWGAPNRPLTGRHVDHRTVKSDIQLLMRTVREARALLSFSLLSSPLFPFPFCLFSFFLFFFPALAGIQPLIIATISRLPPRLPSTLQVHHVYLLILRY